MKTKTLLIFALSLSLAGAAKAQTTWYYTNKANLLKQGRSFGVAVLNEKIYLVGGYCGSHCELATTDEYDPVSDTWTSKANMQTVRYTPAAAALNGKLYAIGGYTSASGDPVIFSTVEQYDPLTDTWTNKANMNQPRFAFQAVTLNGKIYAIGGQYPYAVATSTVEEYDPVSDTWTNRADMPTARVSFGVAVLNGKIYVIGGYTNNTEIAAVYEYDPLSNTWAIKADMPTPRSTLGIAVVNERILAFGGQSAGGFIRATVEEYNPATDSWASKPNLPTSRNECFAVNINSITNTLFVFGGYDDYTMIALSVTPLLNIYTAIELEFFTETNKVYQLQASPDLISWTNVDSTFPGTGDYWTKLYSTRNQATRFYRIHDVTP